MVFVLVACKPKASAPKIFGADDITIPRFSTFDPGANVTAEDYKGNDLTEKSLSQGKSTPKFQTHMNCYIQLKMMVV